MSNDEEPVVSLADMCEDYTRHSGGCENAYTCTYSNNYATRQNVYSCITCFNLTGKMAGICYPCSENCHEDHDLIDLYTKRHFKCDCGNTKFPEDIQCNLMKDKDEFNVKNKYNHNFKNEFCVCNCGDGENEDAGDMWQCNVCEDWFHLKHLESKSGDNLLEMVTDSTNEMTCGNCVTDNPWLFTYWVADEEAVENVEGACKFEAISNIVTMPTNKPNVLFWTAPSDKWRRRLCLCSQCQILRPLSVVLGNLDDSVDSYTELSKVKEASLNPFNELNEALRELPHSAAMGAAEGIALLRQEVTRVMKRCAASDTPMTEEDVATIFESINSKRKKINRN